MKCRVKFKKKALSNNKPQICLLNQRGKIKKDLCLFFPGGKMNIKGHDMFLTYLDMARGKCCVAEFCGLQASV